MNFDIKKFTPHRVFISLIIISLAFENFKLFNILGASFKPIQMIALLAILYYLFFKGVSFKRIAGAIVFLLIPLLPLYRVSDFKEFFKSYVIYTIIVLFVAIALPHLKEGFKQDYDSHYRLFNNVIMILCVLGIVQFILMNLFDVMFLEGIFGRFQFRPSSFGNKSGMFRAYSIFHEPSYFGWVLDIALAINLTMKSEKEKKRKPIIIVVLIATIIMTLSSSAIWILAMILAVYFLSIRRVSGNALIIGLFVIALIIGAVAIFDFSFIKESMERLFYETQSEGSSAYERINSPIEYIKKTMTHYPLFGRGMGQEGLVDDVGIIGLYDGVNNSVFGSVVIFGATSIFYYLWLVAQFFGGRFEKKQKMARLILFLTTFGMYFSTGAFLSFDTFIFMIIIMLFVSTINTTEKEDGE